MTYIIIPVFNRKHFTKACLLSLYEQTSKDFEIVVVDHGSTDGTGEMILDEFKDVILVKGDDSLWWAGATNLGINEVLNLQASDNDFILTLNNDLVVEPDYLEQLLIVYRSNEPCLVGSTSVHYNDAEKVQFAGMAWHPVFAKFRSNPIIRRNYSEIRNIDFVESDLLTGRGTLIPVMAFQKYGLYDVKRFPHYAADEDFSLTCKNNGYKLLVAIKAVVHSHVADTGLNFKHSKLSFKQFLKTLSSVKSANNLHVRLNWAKKNSKFPSLYFLIDVFRIFGSYARSLASKNK